LVIWPEAFTRNTPPLVELAELLELELLEDELEELEELLLEDEELEELLLEELELVPPGPVQVGPVKLPSCVPWKPKTLEAVAPGAGTCQLQQLVN
jgi:hypothetical protein